MKFATAIIILSFTVRGGVFAIDAAIDEGDPNQFKLHSKSLLTPALRKMVQGSSAQISLSTFSLCDSQHLADIDAMRTDAIGTFDTLSSDFDHTIESMMDSVNATEISFYENSFADASSALNTLQKETLRAYSDYAGIIKNYCSKQLGQDLPPNQSKETCVPQDTSAIDGIKSTLNMLMTAVTAAEIIVNALRDTGHGAAWGALVIAFGAGTGVPSAAAFAAAVGGAAAASTGITVAKIALKTMDFSMQAIEYAIVTTGCHFKKTSAIHDISFETFDLVDNYMDFVSCPFDQKTFILGQRSPMNPVIRGGCDGIDNDCDSNVLLSIITPEGDRVTQSIEKRVDECDEDLVPPSITLSKDPPSKFYSQAQAIKWFTDYTVVGDDCVPASGLVKTVANITETSITFEVEDPRCASNAQTTGSVNGIGNIIVDGPGSYQNTATFNFRIFNFAEDCEYTGRDLKFKGCNNIDDDCDSSFVNPDGTELTPPIWRIDECDEDMTPPVITLDESVEIPETFLSLQSAIDFYMTNTEGEDDCTLNENLTKTYAATGPNTCGNASIEITVCTPCSEDQDVLQTVNGKSNVVVDGEGRPCNSVTYEVIVDNEAPIVTCGFHKLQDIYFVRDSNFIPDGSMPPPEPAAGEPLHVDYHHILKEMVNVEFWYQIEEIDDTCPHEKVDVDVTVFSNEVERKGREMVDFFTERNIATIGSSNADPVDRLTLFLAPHTCHDHNANKDRSTNCLIEKDLDQNMREAKFTTRFYDVKVEATDTTGNVGSATCTVIVVPEDHYCDQDPSSYRCKKTKSSKAGRAGKYGVNSSKGKGYLPTPKNPFALVNEYELSTKRFVIGSEKLVWDTSIDTRIGVATPAPTGAPTGKGKGKGKGSSDIPKKTTKKSPAAPDVVEIKVSASADLNR